MLFNISVSDLDSKTLSKFDSCVVEGREAMQRPGQA